MHKQQYPSKQYFNNYYGICELKNCKCLLDGCNPEICNNWKPFNVSSYDELIENAKKIREMIEENK